VKKAECLGVQDSDTEWLAECLGVQDSDTEWLLGFMLRVLVNYCLSCLPTLNSTLYNEELVRKGGV